MTPDDAATTPPTVLLPVSEAAPRLGLSVAALKSRVRRGVVTARKGNDGRLLVAVPADAGPRHDAAMAASGGVTDAELAELRDEIGDLREALARAEERAAAQIEAAREVATARVNAARFEVAAVQELAARLSRELADARRPWLARVLAAIRAR